MISTVATVAAAAFFIWHCLARVRPPGIAQLVPRLPGSVRHFIACPWCAGAWCSLAVTLAWTLSGPSDWHWTDVVILWLAASALVGVAGSLLPDDGEAID